MKKSMFNTIISRSVKNQKYRMPYVHDHECHELYYMKKESTTYYIGDKIFHVKEGDFVFVPKGILHRTDYEDNAYSERIVLYFSDLIFSNELQPIKEELCDCRVICVDSSCLAYLEELLRKIEDEYLQEDRYKDFVINLYVTELLVLLCRNKYDYKQELSGMDQTLYLISKYISEHFQEPISLEALSNIFGMSKSYLCRKFKTNTGMGIHEYIAGVRVTNAEKLLRETDLSVTQVAMQCGYNDSNYFSAVFKKMKGITAQKYRKQNRI